MRCGCELRQRAPATPCASFTLCARHSDGGLPTDPYFGNGITELLKRLQPQAVAFNGWPTFNSTAARWIGTEAGQAPDPTWSSGSCGRGNQVCADCKGGNGGDPNDPDWCPAEVDSTLQLFDTWFYVKGCPLHPLKDLVDSYHFSLGRNSNWLLDIAPPPNSTVAPSHAQSYMEFGAWLRDCYGGTPVAHGRMAPSQTSLTVALSGGASFNRVRLVEDISQGQLVHAYSVSSTGAVGGGMAVSAGTSIGAGKIDVLAAPVTAVNVTLTVDAPPLGLTMELFFCAL